jgi:hypothetical protein
LAVLDFIFPPLSPNDFLDYSFKLPADIFHSLSNISTVFLEALLGGGYCIQEDIS